ncbi:MAG: exodeoxyribonuclease VII large subunit, partial [Candidatus Zixiibacteriota bacterium]
MSADWKHSQQDGERPHVFQVSELTREIKGLLEGAFAEIVVEGEISNYHLHSSSGHRYFSLKDPGAALRCVLWKQVGARLRFEPEGGMKVRASGRISVYEPRGEYQLSVSRLEPLGTGELEIAFRQLFERLSQEGLFEDERKRELPEFPFTVGIVTSPTGAAIRDMMNVFTRRNPLIKLMIYPTAVQGDGAGETIAAGLDYFNTRTDVDLIITGRGGGSLEDLWEFNSETVVRAIVRSEIPVVTGIGHEVDQTLADFAADLRAPTPSAAAELAAWDLESARERVSELKEGIAAYLTELVGERREELAQIISRGVFADPYQIVNVRSQTLDQMTSRFALAVKNSFREMRNVLAL